MPVADVKNLEGKKIGTIDLADDVFGVKVNAHLLHEAVRHYLAGKHAGTHKTKDKSEVSGSGKKLWKQKGTGRARVGSIRSPLWRHGGTVHGPTPRSYSYALPKKMIIGALRSALSSKLAEQKMTIVDAWELETHKTKAFRQALTKLDRETPSILLVDNSSNLNLERASRNIDGLTLVPTNALEAYDLLRHDHLMMSREAAVKLSRALSATPVEEQEPIQIQPAPSAATKHAAGEKSEHAKAPAKTHAKAHAAPKAAKKHTAAKKEKPKAKAKPKAKKDK
ncbi:MAG TPA: 50S ribosomal protein L4 [Candidatus Sulfotelmatobacter sp.]|nr:50S ribosomal protein L4 [Candidatus Sulfotelmatobacter sp.]